VQRLAWFAEDGDVLVLPAPPDDAFLDYVTSLTHTRGDTLAIVVPPATGDAGALTPGRLADPEFVRSVRRAVDGREVSQLSALWPDPAVARLARELRVEAAMPGYGFVAQAGGMLVNSKSVFRAIAAGAGVPVPPGAVCTSQAVAEREILDLLEGGEAVVVKHDFLSGGHGNEILSTDATIRPIGVRRVVTVSEPCDVRAYLERYFRDSSAYFVEYTLGDDESRLAGTGELLSAPYAVGQVMPAVGLEPDVLDAMVDGAGRLVAAVHAMGYRGVLGPDAIVTPEREVLFTEYNGRVTGSTHIYERIGRLVVGPGFGRDRIILERVWQEGWSTPSFKATLARLTEAGLAYSPASRTGVVLTNAFDNRNGVMYCIVAEDLDRAWAHERDMRTLFAAGS
jgi:hypothetical protein